MKEIKELKIFMKSLTEGYMLDNIDKALNSFKAKELGIKGGSIELLDAIEKYYSKTRNKYLVKSVYTGMDYSDSSSCHNEFYSISVYDFEKEELSIDGIEIDSKYM